MAGWLLVVPEAQINCSSKQISDKMRTIALDMSLYTNVPVKEAIREAANRLYAGDLKMPPVDKETLIKLAELSSVDVIISTHNGYYQQRDGLVMGSPSAPHFANVWLSTHEPTIKTDAKICDRCMDDILRSIKKHLTESKLTEINDLHPNLKFTVEVEQEGKLPFLDMCIIYINNSIESAWYTKSTDTGLTMNFHALAPRKYKRSVVQGFIHRIYWACSDWKHFHDGICQAKQTLERNQYPPEFYEPIIKKTIENLIAPATTQQTVRQSENQELPFQKMLQFRGRETC